MLVRTNMRYRGPMESTKEEAHRRQVDMQKKQVRLLLEKLELGLKEFTEDVYSGGRATKEDETISLRIEIAGRELKMASNSIRTEERGGYNG